ncbi:MAG: site-2 protease family protein [Planctomycetaceae bacterium]|nr:site-2 protease family protein [Planctomycetaceae bacterium]
MFGSVGPTPYDLCFSIAGIPVRVMPTFWLGAVISGASLLDGGHFELLAIWVACLFVSILIHEMGHAVMAYAYGWPPQVYLHHFGGLAVYHPYRGQTTWQSISVSIAGPAAGFCLYGMVYVGLKLMLMNGIGFNRYVLITFLFLKQINLFWGFVNLLPVLPLDGGRICEALCSRFYRGSAERLAAQISVVVAGIAVAYFLLMRDEGGSMFPVILFGLLCAQNVQTLQSYQGNRW